MLLKPPQDHSKLSHQEHSLHASKPPQSNVILEKRDLTALLTVMQTQETLDAEQLLRSNAFQAAGTQHAFNPPLKGHRSKPHLQEHNHLGPLSHHGLRQRRGRTLNLHVSSRPLNNATQVKISLQLLYMGIRKKIYNFLIKSIC